MKSPFPGMDPFIEACGLWEGFHHHLIESIYRTLAAQLPRGYRADVGVRSYFVLIDTEGKEKQLAKPDVAVTESPRRKRPAKAAGGTAVAEPAEDSDSVAMEAFVAERFEESFVEIYAQREERFLVTCIELLSPSNKRSGSEGRHEYERKRQAMLLGRANFIELDLVRGGQKMPMLTPWPDCPYTLLVSRATRAPHCRVWRGHFDRPLPKIPVPLAEPDPDLSLDLQPLIDEIYSLGRYGEDIDYARPLSPRLSRADAARLRELLKGRAGPRS